MADLLTLDAARAEILGTGTASGDLADDDLVQGYVDAVVPIIEWLSGPVTEVDRTAAASGGLEAIVMPWPMQSVTSIVESGTTLSSSDYDADLAAGIIYRGSSTAPGRWAPGRRNITVTAKTGVATVPGNQKLAAARLFRHLWSTRQGPRPRFDQPGEPGVVVTPWGFAIPNQVAELLVATPPLPGFA